MMERIRIMVINNVPETTDRLRHAFEPERYQVETANNRASVLSMLEEYKPHLVILGTAGADFNGLEILSFIRGRWEVPVIMLSENRNVVSLAKALASGADDYLAQPFSGLELRARVRAKLRRAAPSLTPV